MKPLSRLLCLLVLFPSLAFPWGRYGHEVSAHIAEHELTPTSRSAIQGLLGDQSLAEVANWADEVRPDRAETAPLHYINGPVEALEPQPDDYELEAGNVYSAILGYARRLADDNLSKSQRAEALKFLVHFIGDLHQPLHCGFAEDRGGNDIPAVHDGEPINLHHYWDHEILAPRQARYSPQQLAAILHDRHHIQEHIDTVGTDDPRQWIIESRRLIFNGIYPMPRVDVEGENGVRVAVLDDSYGEIWRPVAERQLARAGFRLAATLNILFASGESPFDSPPIPFPPPPAD